MLIHFALYNSATKDWHVAYTRPGRTEFLSVLECPSEAVAERETERLNAEQAMRQTAPTPTGDIPWRAVHGFYDDRDGLGL